MGASVVKVEPPGGDPLARMCPGYYEELSAGQEVVRLDLKDRDDRVFLDDWLGRMDLLLTASRPAALGRARASWPGLRARPAPLPGRHRRASASGRGCAGPRSHLPGAFRDAVAARDATRSGGRPGGGRAGRERPLRFSSPGSVGRAPGTR